MFRDWDNFYLIIGSAAGALIGLMFVVVTLMAGRNSSGRMSYGSKVFLTPIVFHFAAVVVVSALSAVPEMPLPSTAAILLVSAIIGFVYSIVTTVRMFRLGQKYPPTPEWSDKWFYGFLPAAAYLLLAAGAAEAAWLSPERAAYVVGATMLALLLISIRNAWDLATFLVPRAPDPG